MKRIFDIIAAVCALAVFGLPMLVIAVVVRLSSPGPALYWSERIGRDNKLFKMPKFRTMRADTPPMATHLMSNPGKYLAPGGALLRKTSLDELPQLFSILVGDMSFVGPRPALFNQNDLIALRTEKNVHKILPGLTGWAQVNGRDHLPIPVKVDYDEHYLKNQSVLLDSKILLMTVSQVLFGKGVSH